MNLYQYLNTIKRLWDNNDGEALSKFISLSGNHAENRNLLIENPELMIERELRPPLDEVVNFHLKALYYKHEARK